MLDPHLTEEHHRKEILALLIKLKNVDGEVTIVEDAYIQKVAWSLNLTNDDIIEVQNEIDQYDQVFIPETEKDRMTILYYLLFFMHVDGKVMPEEEKLIQEFGFRLGFRTALTNDLIGVIKDHATTHVPPEKMIEAIKKYLN